MRQGGTDVGLEQDDHREHDIADDIANEPVDGLEVKPSRSVKERDDDAAAERHLHGARAFDQLEDFVDQDRHHEDVDEIPPADGRAVQKRCQPSHRARAYALCPAAFRISSATRTTCTISSTACTRTMCAPARTAAVTAAAGPQSRSLAGPSPDAARLNDMRDGPTSP